MYTTKVNGAMTTVIPNRRGLKSREAVLDAAEEVMAERGYEAATLTQIVEVSGIPMSSVYHYFKSKNGVLHAVLERGARRFIDTLDLPAESLGDPRAHAAAMSARMADALAANPRFLRLIFAIVVQPRGERDPEADAAIAFTRSTALEVIRDQIELATGFDAGSPAVDRVARFALAVFDGAFIAAQPSDPAELMGILELLPGALAGVAEQLLGEPLEVAVSRAARSS